MAFAFVSSTPLSLYNQTHLQRKLNAPVSPLKPPSRFTTQSNLSAPFPIADPFAYPSVVFTPTAISLQFRPDLLGSLLWIFALYFGFSQRFRFGSKLLDVYTQWLESVGVPLADSIALATHTVPFLFAGIGVDALLRYGAGGNAVWAVALGVSCAMYAGVYELGRASAVAAENAKRKGNDVFREFAERRLEPRGRCHFVDVRNAVRDDSKARTLARLSDEELRQLIKISFPKARRSPNGFYRGVGVRKKQFQNMVTASEEANGD